VTVRHASKNKNSYRPHKNKAGDCQHPTHQNGPGPIFMTFLTKRTEQNVQIVRF